MTTGNFSHFEGNSIHLTSGFSEWSSHGKDLLINPLTCGENGLDDLF